MPRAQTTVCKTRTSGQVTSGGAAAARGASGHSTRWTSVARPGSPGWRGGGGGRPSGLGGNAREGPLLAKRKHTGYKQPFPQAPEGRARPGPGRRREGGVRSGPLRPAARPSPARTRPAGRGAGAPAAPRAQAGPAPAAPRRALTRLPPPHACRRALVRPPRPEPAASRLSARPPRPSERPRCRPSSVWWWETGLWVRLAC